MQIPTAIMPNLGSPNSVLEMSEARAAADSRSIDIVPLEVRGEQEIAPAFEALKGRAQALYVVLDPIINAHRVRISILALGARLPTVVPFRTLSRQGTNVL
jgi:putative tryptophan/tyrosine transport system substrate-binding protein